MAVTVAARRCGEPLTNGLSSLWSPKCVLSGGVCFCRNIGHRTWHDRLSAAQPWLLT
jgi:hypothetical protein